MIRIAHMGSFDVNLGDNIALYNIQKRINELLFIRNEDNKIEIDAEIYNILVSKL